MNFSVTKKQSIPCALWLRFQSPTHKFISRAPESQARRQARGPSQRCSEGTVCGGAL